MRKSILLLPVLFSLSAVFANCDKEPQIITETVVKTDTLVIVQTDTVLLHVTDTLTVTEFIDDTATTFVLARHAETTGSGSDPVLSTAGQERAGELARVLKNVPLSAVYSTNFNRTRQTAQPAATDKNLNLQTYDPFAPGPLADAVLNTYKGHAVLVLGHSNTVPTLLNTLIGANTYSQLPESQFDNLYIVTVFKKGKATVVHLKYGKPS